MFNNLSLLNKWNKSYSTSKIMHTLLLKEQFKYLKTTHSYHLVDPSPWPLVSIFFCFYVTSGVFYICINLLVVGVYLLQDLLVFYVMYTWWRDILEKLLLKINILQFQKGLRLGMVLFIVSEVMFFFAFFWAFFHSSIAPVYNIGGVWPPKAISTISTYTVPLTNTFFY
jgi:cytochrome c oxidase subunit 3